MTPAEKETVGTDIIMVLKEDAENEDYSQYLEEYTLAGLVKKYKRLCALPDHDVPRKEPPEAQTRGCRRRL